MVRRRLTLKRIDPWSVLKFGAILNVAFLAIGLLIAGVIWFVIDRLNIVDQVCGIAADVGFTNCGVEPGPAFRVLVLLGLLWVVVQTAVLVFLAFLHNLIADLTGGLAFTMIDDTPGSAARGETPARTVTGSSPSASSGGQRRRDTTNESTAAHVLGPISSRKPTPSSAGGSSSRQPRQTPRDPKPGGGTRAR